MSFPSKKFAVAWGLLFALTVGLRLAYGLFVMGHPGPGYVGAEMERAAVYLVREGTIANVYSDTSGPSAHVAPAYAYFLAALYTVFGLPDAHGWIAQVTAAALATGLGIGLLPLVGRRFGLHPAAGWIAAVALALCPFNLYVESWGAWEQPVAALVLIGALLIFAALRAALAAGRGWQVGAIAAGCGLLVGLSALLSPALLPAAGAMVMAVVASAWRTRRAAGLAAGALVLTLAALCTLPWAYRNHVVLGRAVPLRSNFGLELWIGNNDQANGKTFVTFFDDPKCLMLGWHPMGSAQERARLHDMGEVAYMRAKQQEAVAWIASHPARFVELTVNRFRYYWFPTADLWSPKVPFQRERVWVIGLLGTGAFLGVAWLLWRRHPQRWLLAAALLGPSLVYMITHVDSRYRYPTLALSALLTCHVGLTAWNAVRQRLQSAPRARSYSGAAPGTALNSFVESR